MYTDQQKLIKTKGGGGTYLFIFAASSCMHTCHAKVCYASCTSESWRVTVNQHPLSIKGGVRPVTVELRFAGAWSLPSCVMELVSFYIFLNATKFGLFVIAFARSVELCSAIADKRCLLYFEFQTRHVVL